MHESSAYRGEYAVILQDYAVTPDQIVADEIYVLEEGKAILGFFSLANVRTIPELDLMFVADHAQGRRVGASLFEHMKRTAHSLGIREVKIVAHPPAEAFYVRMGATRVGVKAPSGRARWSRLVLALSVQDAT